MFSISQKIYSLFISLAIFLVFDETSAFIPLHSDSEVDNYPICVIGAGFAGLGVGTLLKKKGYNVEIFEANDRVGGKAETFRESDQVLIEKCPLFIKNESELILTIIKQKGLTLRLFNQQDRAGFDARTGFVSALPTPSPQQQTAIAKALEQFQVYSNQYVNDLDYGYLDTNPELYVSMQDWLIARDLSVLIPLFVPLITVQGYGDLRDIPALYVLKEFANIVTSTKGFLTVDEGLDVLVNKIAEPLNVFLNYKAEKIHRLYEDIQFVEFSTGYRRVIKRCNKVILAFPPLLVNLKKLVADLTQEEEDVLSEVKVQRYTAGGHHIPTLDHTVYYEVFTQAGNKTVLLPTPIGNGEPVGLVRQSTRKLQDVYSSYSFQRGDFNSSVHPRQLQQFRSKLDSFLLKISPAAKTYFLHATEYFPHVTTQSLQNGFYQKFDNIQGNQGLYYATSLLTFETMEKTLEMASSFVEKYFDEQ